jgi:hypothetical protein
MTAHAAIQTGHEPAVLTREGATPRWWDTYSLAYAFGIMWLAVTLIGLGTQPNLSFNAVYDLLLFLPPVATAICVLIVDPSGTLRSLPFRALVLMTVAGVVSVLSTVLLTPLLVVMFRGGVGHDLGLSGLVSTISLLIVGSPMVFSLVDAVRRGRWAWVVVLALGLCASGVALAMALAPGGPLASLLRLDQGEILMITASWWLPWYAASAAFARRLGMA